jgi:hypothetical protein
MLVNGSGSIYSLNIVLYRTQYNSYTLRGVTQVFDYIKEQPTTRTADLTVLDKSGRLHDATFCDKNDIHSKWKS